MIIHLSRIKPNIKQIVLKRGKSTVPYAFNLKVPHGMRHGFDILWLAVVGNTHWLRWLVYRNESSERSS